MDVLENVFIKKTIFMQQVMLLCYLILNLQKTRLYLSTILEKQTKQFDYNNKINSKNLDKITLKLPSFEFMEKFMEEIKL